MSAEITEKKTLYRFYVDDNGQVKREETKDYSFIENKNWNSGVKQQSYYRYKKNGTFYYAYVGDFDRYVNKRVYSWNPDIDSARGIIRSAIEETKKIAILRVKRADNILEILH